MLGQAAFPRLAAHSATRDWRQLKRTLLLSLAGVLVLAVPAVLGLVGPGREVVRAVFEQGKFDAVARDLTYDVLTIYALGLPAYVATEVITRGLISLRDTRRPLATNAVQLLDRIGIMTALVGSEKVNAIPLALTVTASIETFVLGGLLLLKLRRLTPTKPAPAL